MVLVVFLLDPQAITTGGDTDTIVTMSQENLYVLDLDELILQKTSIFPNSHSTTEIRCGGQIIGANKATFTTKKDGRTFKVTYSSSDKNAPPSIVFDDGRPPPTLTAMIADLNSALAVLQNQLKTVAQTCESPKAIKTRNPFPLPLRRQNSDLNWQQDPGHTVTGATPHAPAA